MVGEELTMGVELVPNEDQLEDVQDTFEFGFEDSGQASGGGGGGGGLGGMMQTLTSMSGLLKVAVGLLGLIALVPGMMEGLMRLLEVALLPVTALFTALLAPLIQRLMRWLVENDILGMMQDFARTIVSNVTSLVKTITNLISDIQSFFNNPFGLGGGSEGESRSTTERAVSDAAKTALSTAVDPTGIVSFVVQPPIGEFTSSTWDETAGEKGSETTQEDGP